MAGQLLQKQNPLWTEYQASLSSKSFVRRQGLLPTSPSALPCVVPTGENTVTCSDLGENVKWLGEHRQDRQKCGEDESQE